MKKNLLLFILFITLCPLTYALRTPLILQGNSDGNKWHVINAPTQGNLISIAQVDNALIAVGQNAAKQPLPLILNSTNKGITWSVTPNNLTTNLLGIMSHNHHWIAFGNGPSIFLNEKSQWIPANLPSEMTTGNTAIEGIASNGNNLIAVGHYLPPPWRADYVAAMLMSNDQGAHWSLLNAYLPSELNKPISTFHSVAWLGNQWLAFGNLGSSTQDQTGFILTSSDAFHWSYAALPHAIDIKSIAGNSNLLIAIATKAGYHHWDEPYFIKSVDNGKTWQNIEITLPGNIYKLNKISWNGNTWIAVGTAYEHPNEASLGLLPAVLTSKDGNNWVIQKMPSAILTYTGTSPNISDIIWDGAHWLAVGLYDKPRPGCENFYGHWRGTLRTVYGQSINVNDLGFVMIGEREPGHYNVGGGAIYYTDGIGQFGMGLGGSCDENGDTATISVFNNTDYKTRVTAQKALTSDTMQVTQSYLDTSHGYLNFTGTLVRND